MIPEPIHHIACFIALAIILIIAIKAPLGLPSEPRWQRAEIAR